MNVPDIINAIEAPSPILYNDELLIKIDKNSMNFIKSVIKLGSDCYLDLFATITATMDYNHMERFV
jgi:hypothetical protein